MGWKQFEEESEATDVVGRKRHKKYVYTLDTIPGGIPTKQVKHRLDVEDPVWPQCGDSMAEIGKEVVKTQGIIHSISSGRIFPSTPGEEYYPRVKSNRILVSDAYSSARLCTRAGRCCMHLILICD